MQYDPDIGGWIRFMSRHPRYAAVLFVVVGGMTLLVWTALQGETPSWLTRFGPTIPAHKPAP